MNHQPKQSRDLDWLKTLHDARHQTSPLSDEWQFLCDAVWHVLGNRTAPTPGNDWRTTAEYPFERLTESAPSSLPKAA